MTNKRLVLTTTGSQEEARKIARALVDRQLAACVNIVPGVESIYRWKGKVETAAECLLIIKTTADAFERLAAALHELHSYELPECVQIAIEDGSAAYLDFIEDSVG
jgi:periplasmic divalent cation tolerance protein